MLQTQPRTPGRETALSHISSESGTKGPLDHSQIHEDVSLLIHSHDGTLCCLVAGDGTWLSATDRKSKKHTTSPLSVCLACKHGLVSDDGAYIILVDVHDGIWLHRLDKKWTGRIQLPSSLISEFDTIRGCHCTIHPGVFVLVTERRLILFKSSFILDDDDTPITKTCVKLCVQGFETEVVAVSGPHVDPESGQEYVIVQTDQNCYIGTIEGEECVLLAMYEDLDDGSLVYGNSTAMATSQTGPYVAFAMQGKEVHVWDITLLIKSYEKDGVIQGVTPIILDDFEEDVTMLLWSTHPGSMYLATSGSSRTCQIWDFQDIQNKQEPMTCLTESCIREGCFHPGSNVLSLLSDDGSMSFFQISPFSAGTTRIHNFSIPTNQVPDKPSLRWESGDDGRLFLSLSKNLLSWETRDLMQMIDPRGMSSELKILHQEPVTEIAPSVGPETPVNVNGPMPSSPSGGMFGPCSDAHNPHMVGNQMCIKPWDQGLILSTCMHHGPACSAPASVWMQDQCCYPGPASPPSPVFWGFGPSTYIDSHGSYLPTHHPSDSTVYIGNIPSDMQEDTISWICSHYGNIFDVQIIKDSHLSLRNKGYAFVTFSDPAMARRCMQNLHGQIIHSAMGSFKIRVAPSKRRPFKREA
jgi:hypothetical protein